MQDKFAGVDFCRGVLFRIDGNLYGRRTAGATYRNELEGIICEALNTDEAGFQFEFVRGDTDSTVYRCAKTRCVLLHHVDESMDLQLRSKSSEQS